MGIMVKLSKIEINVINRRFTGQPARLSVHAHPATKCMFVITMFKGCECRNVGGMGWGGGESFEVEKPSLNRDPRRLTYTARQTKYMSPQCGITKPHASPTASVTYTV